VKRYNDAIVRGTSNSRARIAEDSAMALITWNDSLSVSVAEFDQQHMKLIALINELNDAMSVGKGKDVLEKTVYELITYTRTHFKAEEKCFARFQYPDTFNHRIEHLAFIKKVSDFKAGIESGNLPLSVEVLRFTSDWFKKHIMVTDKKYSQFFNERGLK
jgi:hemerythrin